VATSAAILMVSVFAIFATLSMNEMKQMGVGLAVAGRIGRDSTSPIPSIDDHPTEHLPAVVMPSR
jgi:putative drug exporter of the RND superfamily